VERVGEPLTMAELEAGLDHVRRSPADQGSVELIVRRPAVDERECLDAGSLTLQDGLDGDSWRARGSRSTEDGSAHPDTQLNVTNARFTALVAADPERRQLAGDQLHVDLDLSHANLPAGTRLALGDAVIEVRLRGLNARVVVPGAVRRGDVVRKLPTA
jgi:hypothetical protein